MTDTSGERRTMKIDTKYWKLYRTDAEGKVIQPPLAEADTPEELWKLLPRLDYDYAIYYKRQRID